MQIKITLKISCFIQILPIIKQQFLHLLNLAFPQEDNPSGKKNETKDSKLQRVVNNKQSAAVNTSNNWHPPGDALLIHLSSEGRADFNGAQLQTTQCSVHIYCILRGMTHKVCIFNFLFFNLLYTRSVPLLYLTRDFFISCKASYAYIFCDGQVLLSEGSFSDKHVILYKTKLRICT